MAAGYPGLPGYRPNKPKQPPAPGRGGRASTGATPQIVIKNSNAAYAKRHPGKPGGSGGSGSGKTDPRTGLPVFPSEHEMRAEANANAWKSIQAMQAALPSQGELMLRYGGQRAAVAPLIDAHREWLEKAGQYQVNMTNAISGMVQGAAGAGDANAAGVGAAAGAPLGTSFPGATVSPTGAAMPVAAYGTSFANYLHSLVPYASALGGNAMQQINNNETQDLRTLDQSRKEIGLKRPELVADAYSNISNAAVNKYKAELAMLTAGDKSAAGAARDAETKRHHQVLEQQARDNAATTKRRVDAAIQLGRDKLKAGGTAKDGSARTAGDVSGLRGALGKALEMYNNTGGKSAPSRYGGELTYQPPADPNNPRNKPALQSKKFTGPTPADVRRQMAAWKKQHDKLPEGPIPAVVWGQPKGSFVQPVPGFREVKGRRGEYNRRQEAWRYLKTVNDNSLHPISTAELQNMWRSMVGAPTK